MTTPTPSPLIRGTLVIADDDVATRMLLSQVLTRASFIVYAVENGQLACEAVQLFQPDLILLDWIMPVMDGRRAAEQLKADAKTRAIPIIMLTTHARGEDRVSALAAGVEDYLTKPFNARELVARIEQQLRCARDARYDAELRLLSEPPPAAHSLAGPLTLAGVVAGPIQIV